MDFSSNSPIPNPADSNAAAAAPTGVSQAAATSASGASAVRIARLRDAMAQAGLAAFCVRDTSSIRWLTGFDGVFDSEAAHALYVDARRVVLHTDSRYAGACEVAARGTSVEVNSERKSHAEVIAQLWLSRAMEDGVEAAIGATRAANDATADAGAANDATGCANAPGGAVADAKLGIEDAISVAEYRKLKDALLTAFDQAQNAACPVDASAARVYRVPLRETADFVLNLRAVKDAGETARMKAAQAITDAAFAHIAGFVRPGLTEREVQLELDDFMRRHGADDLAFSSIVATGANGANPHAVPGSTRLEAGQCVVLDFGARAHGYCSDMTRMLFLGTPSQRMQDAYAALVCANEEVQALLRPGVTGKEAHELAERILAAAGFEGRMGHGLGHGVGIDIHESPSLNTRNDKPLVAGNVVTVEPGIYLQGEFGMRLEDFGVVTQMGFETFTQSSHDMTIL